MPRLPLLAATLTMTALPAFAAPDVVTDMSPTGALVQEVMGDLGTVHVLLPRAASAHQYTMRPSDARSLQGADLLVISNDLRFLHEQAKEHTRKESKQEQAHCRPPFP